ncbi:MAG: hypothetical protein J5597_01870 [Spirochaetaceae bacterium]|nr:hypothetical protein [Spirochaetaceae bacterium]
MNRKRLLIAAPILFVFGLVDFILIFALNFYYPTKRLFVLIYFSLFTISSFVVFIFSLRIKNCPKEKAYFLKTIPFFVMFYVILTASLYSFYILRKPFNGFLTFNLTCFISLLAFSFPPLPFFLGVIATTVCMAPGLYKTFGLSGLADVVLTTVIILCFSLYKKRMEKKQILLLKKQKNTLEAKTFGNFTLIYENKVVKFSRTKSNELIAYLIYKNGSSANTKELISVLWGDQADSARYGNNLRNLIVDIKHSLNELEIQNFFIAEYNNFRINPEAIKCDYYDFLSGDTKAINSFAGEFMNQYSWAEESAGFLEMKALKNQV